jgi:hypothetical protein
MPAGSSRDLQAFRERIYRCASLRADALFELADAILTSGTVSSPPHLPWEKPLSQKRLTPQRVLRAFCNLLPGLGTPAAAPKPRGRSPGRPKGNLSGQAERYPAIKKAV